MKELLYLMILAATLTACRFNFHDDEPMLVIFETDAGNDVDDALAMDMLYKYMDEGRIDLLAVMLNKEGRGSAEFVDLMNCWYGHHDIPIGIVRDGAICGHDARNYAKSVAQMQKEDGSPLFARCVDDHDALPDAHVLYRKILSEVPDNSVTIISVGFSTNLARLLDTPGDEFSPLCGSELVAKKVKLLCTMGGNIENPDSHEYNIVKDIPAAQKVFEQWPTALVTSPFELGWEIRYPASSIENDFAWTDAHPVVEAYKSYMPMPYDRPTWDLTAALYAVEGLGDYFTLSEWGTISVDDEGGTTFHPSADGGRAYLMCDETQRQTVLERFVELIPTIPEAQKR